MAAVLSLVDDEFTIQATYRDKMIPVHKQHVRIRIHYPSVLEYCMRNYRRMAHILPPHCCVPTAGIFNQSSEPRQSLIIFLKTVFQAATTNQLLLT